MKARKRKHILVDAGATLVEFTVVIMAFFILLGFLLDMAIYVYRFALLDIAVKESLREVVATSGLTGSFDACGEVETRVSDYLNIKFHVSPGTVTVTSRTEALAPGTPVPQLTVWAAWPQTPITSLFLLKNITISTVHRAFFQDRTPATLSNIAACGEGPP